MSRLLRFWFLTRREKQFFCEACFVLLLVNLCVRTIAFRHIDSFLRARWKGQSKGAFSHVDDIKLVKLSLSRAAKLFPWKNLCLSRSITAFAMLRRRGIPAVMFAGVKFSEGSSLLAHAWVHAGGDEPESAGFAPLIRIGHER